MGFTARSWWFYDFGWSVPTTFVFGGGFAPEIDEISRLELELLASYARLGSQRPFQPELGCLLDHRRNGDLADALVIPRVAGDAARHVVELRLASRLKVCKPRKVAPVEGTIGRVTRDGNQRILSQDRLGYNDGERDLDALLVEHRLDLED